MSKLFMKTSRLGDRRTFAWLESRAGQPVLGPFTARQSVAEAGEFDFLTERGRSSGLGAGGQFEYRIYDLAEPPHFPYAIVYPTIASVREQFPAACRLVNLRTGEESALCDSLDHARATLKAALSKQLKGSFGARRA
jgi:hypothetical protein